MTILKINKGDLLPTGVEAIGWTDGDGTGHDGYHVVDYVDSSGRYLGPDGHGIEPIFRVKTDTKPNLAQISHSLRFCNLSCEEDATIPAPWGYDNIPQAIQTETRHVSGTGYKPHTLTIETFSDGSFFGVSS